MSIKERPILFSGAMVRALLDGSKTQTRRVVKGELTEDFTNAACKEDIDKYVALTGSPYGQPGERLWVRESHAYLGERLLKSEGQPGYLYRADSNEFDGAGITWKPSIHMPRAASRLLLEITAVRCERLQEISEADAVAEGISSYQAKVVDEDFETVTRYQCYDEDAIARGKSFKSPIDSYCSLWQKINGPGSWAANPWVWVVEFKVIEGGKEVASA